MSRIDRRDIAEAVASGAVTAVWYALPDAVASRRARAALKVGLLVPVVGLSVVQSRRALDEVAAARASDAGAGADDALARVRALTATTPVLDSSTVRPAGDPTDDGRPAWKRGIVPAASAVAGAALAAGVVVGTVAAERGIHRLGRRLGARGVSLPHTRVGLVAGLVTAAISAATAITVERTPAA